MVRLTTWAKNIWARRWKAIAIVLALLIALPVVWLALPNRTRWQLSYSFNNFWRSLTEDWGDKWDKILQIIGINTIPEGAQIVAACAGCDVCAAAKTRFFHQYTARDVKAIINSGGKLNTNIDALIIDIRPTDEFEKGFIPGSVSMPLEELKQDIWPIRRDTPLIIVGSGGEDYRKIGKMVVEDWVFYNTGYLVGGIKAWDGQLESYK